MSVGKAYPPFLTIMLIALLAGAIPGGVGAGQDTFCPDLPESLNSIDSVRDLEWLEADRLVRMGLLEGDARNQYLQAFLTWDIVSGEIEAVTLPGTVEAIRLVSRLGLQNSFFAEGDRTHLELSPSLRSAVYVRETEGAPPGVLHSMGLNSDEETELTGLPEGSLDFLWYSDDELILVIEPIYGPGYNIDHVCLDGSCLVDVSGLTEAVVGRPGEHVERRKLALYDTVHSRMMVYDLDSQTIQADFPLNVRLLPNLRPIWSVDGNALYVLGFDEEFGVDLTLYQLVMATGELRVITRVESDGALINDWLIAPQNDFLIFVTSRVQAVCY